jgi:molybdopterin converting factor small subunit
MFVAIKFIGTTHKFYGSKEYKVELEEEAIVSILINKLKVEFSTDENLDNSNMLVLVNGKEISIVNGLQTELRDNDIITFIPVSHGG